MNTWMCKNGLHGTRERQYGRKPSLIDSACAGFTIDPQTRGETDCTCECHA